MKNMKFKWIVFSFAVVGLSGCWTVKEHGMGKCREYNPWCSGADSKKVCVIDDKGCELCTCVKMNGEFPVDPPQGNRFLK